MKPKQPPNDTLKPKEVNCKTKEINTFIYSFVNKGLYTKDNLYCKYYNKILPDFHK